MCETDSYTHSLDTADVEESWMYPGRVEDALSYVEGWDPVVRAGAWAPPVIRSRLGRTTDFELSHVAVMETTPEGALIDWKLVFRDPLPTWVSKGGRTCVYV